LAIGEDAILPSRKGRHISGSYSPSRERYLHSVYRDY